MVADAAHERPRNGACIVTTIERPAVTIRELGAEDCIQGYSAMHALRPALTEEDFRTRVPAQMNEGYRLLGAFRDGEDTAISVAGFRYITNLAHGRHCYIDDLSTLPEARGTGAASLLLERIAEDAQRAGIRKIHLDSGVQAERAAAHRLYFARGFRIVSYHFSREV